MGFLKLFDQTRKYRLIFYTVSLQSTVCAFNFLLKGQYSNYFIEVASSSKSFSGETFLLIKKLIFTNISWW